MTVASLCAGGLAAIAGPAHADSTGLEAESAASASEAGTPAPPRAAGLRWYGYQLFLVDGIAAGCLSAGPIGDAWGLALYTIGGMTLHTVHGHPVRAVASVGLRIGAPVAGALLAVAAAGPRRGNDLSPGYPGELFAVGAGVIGAIVIDDFALSFDEDSEPAAKPPVSVRRAVLAIAPTFTVVPERQQGTRATLGVVGQF